jgi:hypothetical protein
MSRETKRRSFGDGPFLQCQTEPASRVFKARARVVRKDGRLVRRKRVTFTLRVQGRWIDCCTINSAVGLCGVHGRRQKTSTSMGLRNDVS